MELKCELSPLVYAVLYRLLADDIKIHDLLAERLSQVGWELEWLGEAAERYEQAWKWQVKHASAADDLTPLSNENALLASWILAALRTTSVSYEFSSKLRAAVTTRALKEIPGVPGILPSQWCPEVAGWTLGVVIGTVDRSLPIVPAMLPADPNVKAAYEGLIEHVLHLSSVPAPWPEMLGTSTFWRGTGLAEGLKPEARDGQDAIKQLIFECRTAVPDDLRSRLNKHFGRFAETRNALSHVADKPPRLRFVDVKEAARDWDQIRLTILGLTQFLGLQVSADLLDGAASRVVRTGTWDDLYWELSLYGEPG